MKILRNIEVPTGNILVVEGEHGKLELLSLGDYGKEVNVKCDAMGLTREPSPVRHTNLLPLTTKWVITVSTQVGCRCNCNFCDVPLVGPGKNATVNDLLGQVRLGLSLHPEVGKTDRLNIHYARMGEPTWNPAVLECTRILKETISNNWHVHPVVSTMMPKNNPWLKEFLYSWMDMKNRLYDGNAGLQLSINSTDVFERKEMFNDNAMRLDEIEGMMDGVIERTKVRTSMNAMYSQSYGIAGRKITLNFAVAGYEVDPQILRKYFPPKYYICKLTPMHKTHTALKNDVKTEGDYTEYHPYEKIERDLKMAGYDVLVFIASEEEDLGRITCGNAILSGSMPETKYKEIAV